MLGPDHPKTRKWQQDLFFLINAPAVQYLVQQQAAQKKAAAAAASSTSATKLALPAAEPDAAANPQEWWLRNMANGAAASAEGGGPDFWQRNLGSADGDGDGDALAFMQQMFAETAHFTPNDGGGGANGGGPNLGYANDWVAKVFEAPAGDAGGVVDEKMGDALDWLQSTRAAGGRRRRRRRRRGGRGGGRGARLAAEFVHRARHHRRQPLALAQPQRDAGHRRAGQPVGVHAAAERAGRAGVGDARVGRRRARRRDERGARRRAATPAGRRWCPTPCSATGCRRCLRGRCCDIPYRAEAARHRHQLD